MTEWGTIRDQTISFPMDVPALNAATMMFTVPAAPARALLPGDAFELVETGPDSAQLIVAACDYRENPWGAYNEINLGFLVRPVGAPEDVAGSFVYRMPVNEEFTCEAGNRVMGFPKTVEVIDAVYGAEDVTFRMVFDGEPALELRVPRIAAQNPPTRISTVSYSYLDGAPLGTTLEMEMGEGVPDPSEVRIEVGKGPVADELRSLGLPKVPDLCSWGEGLAATFHLPQPV